MRKLTWALILWAGCGFGVYAEGAEDGLIVTGEGIIAAVPDMATLSLGVTTTGSSAAETMRANAISVAAVLAKLDQLGIAARDRQTRRFYLRPIWSNRTQSSSGAAKITGYEAGNSVSVRVRDLDALGDILDGVIALGGNQFNGLSFGLQNDAAARSAARKAAVEDAIARASELAAAAGLQLGQVKRLTENPSHGGPVMMESMARGAAMGDAVASGEVEIRTSVTMVFDIAPKP